MSGEQYMGVVCPLEGKTDRKNRTPDAERKWRKRHGLPPVRGQGQRGPGKEPRADRQEVARAVARVLIDNPLATATLLAQISGLVKEGCNEKDHEAVVVRVRRALKSLQQMPGLAGDEALAEAVRQAFVKREEEKERRRQEREKKQVYTEEEAALMAWLQHQQAVNAAEMSARKVQVGGGDWLKWAGSAYELDYRRNKYICTLEPTSRPADLPLKISATGNIPVATGFKKGKGGARKAVDFPVQKGF